MLLKQIMLLKQSKYYIILIVLLLYNNWKSKSNLKKNHQDMTNNGVKKSENSTSNNSKLPKPPLEKNKEPMVNSNDIDKIFNDIFFQIKKIQPEELEKIIKEKTLYIKEEQLKIINENFSKLKTQKQWEILLLSIFPMQCHYKEAHIYLLYYIIVLLNSQDIESLLDYYTTTLSKPKEQELLLNKIKQQNLNFFNVKKEDIINIFTKLQFWNIILKYTIPKEKIEKKIDLFLNIFSFNPHLIKKKVHLIDKIVKNIKIKVENTKNSDDLLNILLIAYKYNEIQWNENTNNINLFQYIISLLKSQDIELLLNKLKKQNLEIFNIDELKRGDICIFLRLWSIIIKYGNPLKQQNLFFNLSSDKNSIKNKEVKEIKDIMKSILKSKANENDLYNLLLILFSNYWHSSLTYEDNIDLFIKLEDRDNQKLFFYLLLYFISKLNTQHIEFLLKKLHSLETEELHSLETEELHSFNLIERYLKEIYQYLILWNIILKYGYKAYDEVKRQQKKQQQELFLILLSYKSDLIAKKRFVIDEIIKNITNQIQKNQDDLLNILLISYGNLYLKCNNKKKDIKDKENNININMNLFQYIISLLQSQDIELLLKKLQTQDLNILHLNPNDIGNIYIYLKLWDIILKYGSKDQQGLFFQFSSYRKFRITEVEKIDNIIKNILDGSKENNNQEDLLYLLLIFCRIFHITLKYSSYKDNTHLLEYLISYLKKNHIQFLLEKLNKLTITELNFFNFEESTINYISRKLKLWDIILKYGYQSESIDNHKKQQELFLILTNYNIELIKRKEEIKQIVQNMISNNKYHDLLILLLIFYGELYIIFNQNEIKKYLSEYLLSKLQSEEKTQLLLEIGKLSDEELEMYNFLPSDVDEIKEFLQSKA